MRTIPKAGQFYRHFKGKLYQIVVVAKDAQTSKQRVIYQALYGSFQIYDRELDNFMSRVDKEKYPSATQEYRFEQVILEEEEETKSIIPVKTTITQLYDTGEVHAISYDEYQAIENQRKEIETQPRMHLENRVKGALENHERKTPANGIHDKLIAFLDAKTYTEKLEIFNHMQDDIDEKTINDIIAALDISSSDGSLDEQYRTIKRDLETFARFERTKE